MSDRKEHWEKVYTNRSPFEVSWYQAEPRLSLDLIAHTGVAHDAPIIDVGGGASRLVDALLDDGFTRVAVLDISANALGHARGRLGERRAMVEWIVEDVTRFAAPHPFMVWHDRAVFHFLTAAADRAAYVEALRRAVPRDGHVIMAAFAIGGPLRCSDLDIVQYDAAKMAAELGPEFRFVEERAELHVTPAAREQKFGYYRFMRSA